MTAQPPFPSSVELVLGSHALLVDARQASPLALEAALTSDLKCFLNWCAARRPVVTAVPAEKGKAIIRAKETAQSALGNW